MEINKKGWLDKQLIPGTGWLTVEKLIFFGIILIAALTRFINLGDRPMSHDESLHTYFSYLLSQGQGYQHNPMMHGPLQFHLIGLSYFFFGSSDLVSRIPAATFGVLAVASFWLWRRYLGRLGAIFGALMFTISPFLLYYTRYTREDPYVALSFSLMLYATLRYFETGEHKFLYWISGSFVIHYLTKETSFIYNAEILIFLAGLFIILLLRKPWEKNPADQKFFILSFLGFLLLTILSLAAFMDRRALEAAGTPLTQIPILVQALPYFIGLAIASLVICGFLVVHGLGLDALRKSRTFDLLIVYGTLVLPQLSAFPVFVSGWDPMDYSIHGLGKIAIFLVPILLLTVLIGLWWRSKVWPIIAIIFYIPFFLFYSTFFTNGIGVISGLVGSLGYWLTQQGIQRGSQPFYYYPFITIPLYEFLPAFGSLIAVFFGLSNREKFLNIINQGDEEGQEFPIRSLFFILLTYWVGMTILALSAAGEKMPWLTFHLALPMTFLGGWGIQKLVRKIEWRGFFDKNWIVKILLTIVLVVSLIGAVIVLLDTPTPFSGKDLPALTATTSFIAAVVFSMLSLFALWRIHGNFQWSAMLNLSVLSLVFLLFLVTLRVSYRANFVKFNSGQEYLVYAHSYSGTRELLDQLNEISEKTVGDKQIKVAYDDDTSWPMSWYMREYPNNRFFGSAPDRSLRDYTAIIVGDNNYAKIEPIVSDDYYQFNYIRMVWPNQDYFNLITKRPDPTVAFDAGYSCKGILSPLKLFKSYDFSRLCTPILSADYRGAIFDIWLSGDFTAYESVTGSNTVRESQWEPSDKMRLYVQKEVVNQIWNYGIKIEPQPKIDPYLAGYREIQANFAFGQIGTGESEFTSPRAMAFAPDGTFYVADSGNHRIQHFSSDGTFIRSFGSFGDMSEGTPPLGKLNEPWGIAVAENGDVFVTDTWNHRIQKFTADGKPITSWGIFGTQEMAGALYGPRGISIDEKGRVFVADTGNERILIYDQDGNQLGQVGSEGFEVGQFSEPVDVAFDKFGNLYVTDTWNQRVQVFSEVSDNVFTPIRSWQIDGWNSQSLDNKPYVTVTNETVYITDPEGYRVLAFSLNGDFLYGFGMYGTDLASFGLPNDIASDKEGNVWVVDAANNRILKFTP